MSGITRLETARRAGVKSAFVDRLVELGILVPGENDLFSTADVRRARFMQSIESYGVALDDIGEAIRQKLLTLETFELESFERFSPLSGRTFREVSAETGIPLETMMVVHEAIGFGQPAEDDFVREDELRILPAIRYQLDRGFDPAVIERWLRVYGDSLRRIAETEGAWWSSEIEGPIIASGADIARQMGDASRWGMGLSVLLEDGIVSMYHAQQEHAWTQNILEGFESILEQAGLRSKLAQPPAMCFLDMTGYTKLTEEQGDRAAADLAGAMARMVQRTSRQHRGNLVKWLGDGVMFHYREPGAAALASLEMIEGISSAGMPPAHVGIHAGPVIFQEGDYFGRTVNVAARIAAYARPGEVLASREVVDLSGQGGVRFDEIGPVDLKGVSGDLHLYSVHRAG